MGQRIGETDGLIVVPPVVGDDRIGIGNGSGNGNGNGPSGLDRASTEHDVGSGGVINTSGASGTHPLIAAAGASFSQPSSFALIAGRYPDAIGIDVLLAQAGSQDQAKAMVKKVIDAFKAQTGLDIPQPLVNAALANPARLTDALALDPKQLAEGADAILAGYRAGTIKDVKPKVRILPQHFDFVAIGALVYQRPAESLKELGFGISQGDLKSDLPDAQAKSNTVLAEIFDRLAENPALAAKDRFSVRYHGQEYRSLGSFVGALERNHHQVEIAFNQRTANFADLKTKVGDQWFDVPFGLPLIGESEDGRKLKNLAAHAEMNISVRGPDITANTKFFQGMTATGFFPADLWKTPTWLGGKLAPERLHGAKALKAMELAGHLTEMINAVAKKLDLPFAGYGVLGVCMDSVAVLRHAMTGKIDYWPLVMRDQFLMPYIEQHLHDKKKSDDDDFALLGRSIAAAPNDADGDSTAPARMRSSIVWTEERDPFEFVGHTRRVLNRQE